MNIPKVEQQVGIASEPTIVQVLKLTATACILALLLCGCASQKAGAAEFAVSCPKCATAQRLTPNKIVVSGSVRTDGGWLDERTLHLRCEQRKCRKRFTASNTAFRKEVVAVQIPPSIAWLKSRAKHP